MADEIINEAIVTAEVNNPFDDSTWNIHGESKKEEVVAEQPKVEEVKVEEVVKEEVKEEILEPSAWLKREFGWETPESAKADIEELRKLRTEAKTPEEIKFANDESKRLFESLKEGKEDDVYELLSLKRQFLRAEKLDVTDPKQAVQLLHLNYQLKHKNLEPYEISDLFEENYVKPDKPKQGVTETDEEYEELTQKWQARCDAVDRKIIRDAKIAQPELVKLKSEIVLPDIQKKQEQVIEAVKEPTQEELQAQRLFKENFLKAANKSVSELNGFTAQVKDKDVDYTVSYTPSVEEKAAVENNMKSFAEQGFNANHLFAQRWVNDDGSVNAKKMAEEFAFLDNREKVLAKVANDAANQRLELYLKSKKNINVNETSTTSTFSPNDKSEQEKMADTFFSN